MINYALNAINPRAQATRPHRLGFTHPRTVADDNLVVVMNGAAPEATVFRINKDGRIVASGGLSIAGAAQLLSHAEITGNLTVSGFARLTGASAYAEIGTGSTSGLTASQFSGYIRFNGTGVQHGDLLYFPNGGGKGHWRFVRATGSPTTDPNARIGVGSIYVATKLLVGTDNDAGVADGGATFTAGVNVQSLGVTTNALIDQDLTVAGNAAVAGTLTVAGQINGVALAPVLFTTTTAVTQSTHYTLALSDAGKVVEFTGGSATTATIPANATIAFPVGTVINLCQYGAGQVTVAAAGGVTIRSRNGLKLAGQYSEATLRKRGTNEWVLSGDVTV
jgi:hypothetical protein